MYTRSQAKAYYCIRTTDYQNSMQMETDAQKEKFPPCCIAQQREKDARNWTLVSLQIRFTYITQKSLEFFRNGFFTFSSMHLPLSCYTSKCPLLKSFISYGKGLLFLLLLLLLLPLLFLFLITLPYGRVWNGKGLTMRIIHGQINIPKSHMLDAQRSSLTISLKKRYFSTQR